MQHGDRVTGDWLLGLLSAYMGCTILPRRTPRPYHLIGQPARLPAELECVETCWNAVALHSLKGISSLTPNAS